MGTWADMINGIEVMHKVCLGSDEGHAGKKGRGQHLTRSR